MNTKEGHTEKQDPEKKKTNKWDTSHEYGGDPPTLPILD